MLLTDFILFIGGLQLAAAHFAINYPYWRGDSFQDPASQWLRPCANVNQTESNTNRTLWPLTGGSLLLNVHHLWAFTYVNLGLGGDNTTVFNISLVPGFNQTGNGTFCFPTVTLPASLGVTEGTNASIQVIQIGELGSSLYNCADITFSSNAKILGTDTCQNSTGVGGVPLFSGTSASSKSSNTTTSEAASTTSGAATTASKSSMAVKDISTLTMNSSTVWIAVLVLVLAQLARAFV
ncbi:hypothetical protein MMC07_005187 [Pseudocyphellaria aurata]|nr:hypothetical protein [Pseudocyphellaria aurata]